MITLLAVDPGARTGMASFTDGVLGHAQVIGSDDVDGYIPHDVIVIEFPVIYPHSKARPADILKLAAIAGQFRERFRRSARRVQYVAPRDWKGTVDGDIMTNRIKASLTEEERKVVAAANKPDDHNMLDAVGIGKWALRQPWMRVLT